MTVERWKKFSIDQQIMVIANEMHRGLHSMELGQRESLQLVYERVLHMLELTLQAAPPPSLRRELRIWREFVGGLYLAEAPDPPRHRETLKLLLQTRPALADQVALLAL